MTHVCVWMAVCGIWQGGETRNDSDLDPSERATAVRCVLLCQFLPRGSWIVVCPPFGIGSKLMRPYPSQQTGRYIQRTRNRQRGASSYRDPKGGTFRGSMRHKINSNTGNR